MITIGLYNNKAITLSENEVSTIKEIRYENMLAESFSNFDSYINIIMNESEFLNEFDNVLTEGINIKDIISKIVGMLKKFVEAIKKFILSIRDKFLGYFKTRAHLIYKKYEINRKYISIYDTLAFKKFYDTEIESYEPKFMMDVLKMESLDDKPAVISLANDNSDKITLKFSNIYFFKGNEDCKNAYEYYSEKYNDIEVKSYKMRDKEIKDIYGGIFVLKFDNKFRELNNMFNNVQKSIPKAEEAIKLLQNKMHDEAIKSKDASKFVDSQVNSVIYQKNINDTVAAVKDMTREVSVLSSFLGLYKKVLDVYNTGLSKYSLCLKKAYAEGEKEKDDSAEYSVTNGYSDGTKKKKMISKDEYEKEVEHLRNKRLNK